MDIRDAYTSWSETYDRDRNLTRDLDQAVTREVLSAFGHQTEGGALFPAILEIGCGTGKNTVWLAEIGERVLALDFSGGMLARACGKVQAQHVTFEVADLTKPWPCPDQSIDLVVCNLVLEHIHDLDFIFEQTARVLKAGGHFFVCELHPFRQYLGTQANFQGRQGAVQIQAFVHHLTDFTGAAEKQGLALLLLNEWWHSEDQGKPPRLVSMMFSKA